MLVGTKSKGPVVSQSTHECWQHGLSYPDEAKSNRTMLALPDVDVPLQHRCLIDIDAQQEPERGSVCSNTSPCSSTRGWRHVLAYPSVG